MASHKRSILDHALNGALFQAVRDVEHGIKYDHIVAAICKRHPLCTPEQARELITLAHAGITAARMLQAYPRDKPIPRYIIPKIPG